MLTMKVYHISREDLGNWPMMEPRIPHFASNEEDHITNRICVAPTIIGCLKALEIPESIGSEEEQFFEFNKNGKPVPLYLYSANVDVSDLVAPTIEQVPDVWITGELWVISKYPFKKEANLTVRKHMDLPNCAYSRYCITKEGCEEVCDKVSAPAIYADDMYNFSFIGHNLYRDAMAIKYAEENRLYY